MRRSGSTAAATTTSAARSSGHPALFIILVGAGFLILFVVGLMTQVVI